MLRSLNYPKDFDAAFLINRVIQEEGLCVYNIIDNRFIPKGVAEASQMFLRDTHVLAKLLSYEEYCRRDRW
jgi:hypothetical protein